MDDVGQDFVDARLWLWTDWTLEKEFPGARPKRVLVINPADGDHWMFATLAVLLNERSQQ
jgi:hypothetical protein